MSVPLELQVIVPRLVTAFSSGGWVFQVNPVSVQESEVVQTVPPGPPLVQDSRRRAEKTGSVKPWTENLKKPRWTVGNGPLSTFTLVPVPKLAVGFALST